MDDTELSEVTTDDTEEETGLNQDADLYDEAAEAREALRHSNLKIGTGNSLDMIGKLKNLYSNYVLGNATPTEANISDVTRKDSGEILLTYNVRGTEYRTVCELPSTEERDVRIEDYPLLRLLDINGLSVSQLPILNHHTAPVVQTHDGYGLYVPKTDARSVGMFKVAMWCISRNIITISSCESRPPIFKLNESSLDNIGMMLVSLGSLGAVLSQSGGNQSVVPLYTKIAFLTAFLLLLCVIIFKSSLKNKRLDTFGFLFGQD